VKEKKQERTKSNVPEGKRRAKDRKEASEVERKVRGGQLINDALKSNDAVQENGGGEAKRKEDRREAKTSKEKH